MAPKGLDLGVRKLGVKLTERDPFERRVREKIYTNMVGHPYKNFLNALDYKSTERSRRKRRAAGAHVVLHVSSYSDESEISIYHFITLKNNFKIVFSSGLNLLIFSCFRACD